MSNSVALTATWTDGNGNVGSGNWEIEPSGTGIETGTLAFSSPLQSGQLDSTGSMSVTVRASDDFAPGVLTYAIRISVQGIENIDASDIAVNFTPGGSQQGLFSCLTANGWSPDVPASQPSDN